VDDVAIEGKSRSGTRGIEQGVVVAPSYEEREKETAIVLSGDAPRTRNGGNRLESQSTLWQETGGEKECRSAANNVDIH